MHRHISATQVFMKGCTQVMCVCGGGGGGGEQSNKDHPWGVVFNFQHFLYLRFTKRRIQGMFVVFLELIPAQASLLAAKELPVCILAEIWALIVVGFFFWGGGGTDCCFIKGGCYLKPPKFEHIFVAVITFPLFLLCKYF